MVTSADLAPFCAYYLVARTASSGSTGKNGRTAGTLGTELAPRGIRINAVSPGRISTPFSGKLGLSEQELKDFAEGIKDQVPLQRFGEADEVERAALLKQRSTMLRKA